MGRVRADADFEGIMPFVSPNGWRDKMAQFMVLQDGQSVFGLVCVLAGVLMLWWLS